MQLYEYSKYYRKSQLPILQFECFIGAPTPISLNDGLSFNINNNTWNIRDSPIKYYEMWLTRYHVGSIQNNWNMNLNFGEEGVYIFCKNDIWRSGRKA